jgi:hypothetical protein
VGSEEQFMYRAIDPSEVFVEEMGGIREEVSCVNPWIRFLARFLDYAIFLSLFRLRFDSLVPLQFFIWIPLEALLLSTWGTTPGKWFFKIKLSQGRLVKLKFPVALRRSFNVWLRGLGLMIPLINGLCLLVAYYRLKTFRFTTWDRDEGITVFHKPVGQWRLVISVLITVLFFLRYFY